MFIDIPRTKEISQEESDRQRDIMYEQQIRAIEDGAKIIRNCLPIEIVYSKDLVRIGYHQYSIETCLDAIKGN